MKKITTMKELLNERLSEEDIIKLVSNYDNKFSELEKENEKKEKEIERLKKREQECIDHYLVQCKYASEMESKYITANNIINGMEKFFKYAYDNEVRPLNDRKVSVWTICLDKLQELKESNKE